MTTLVPVTKQIFDVFLRGRGNMHAFLPHETIDEKSIDPLVASVEREYGLNAWFKNIGLVTTALASEEKKRIRDIMRNAGYLAYISNEEMECGPHYIEYCEINLVRYELADFVSAH